MAKAPNAKIPPKKWEAYRKIWEADERTGYAWLVTELQLPVSRVAVSKRAKKDGWTKSSKAQEASKQITAPDNEPAQVTQVTQSNPNSNQQVTLSNPKVTRSEDYVTGRPTDYKPEYADLGFRLMLLGLTRKDLAVVFEVSERAIYRWQEQHPEFRQALWRGGVIADSEIAESMYNRAKGAVVPDTHIALHEGMPVITPLQKHYPPDTAAAKMWLTNRRPLEWKNKVEVEAEIEVSNVDTAAMDAMYEKALSEAAERRDQLLNRGERLGLVLDGELERDDDIIVRDEFKGE